MPLPRSVPFGDRLARANQVLNDIEAVIQNRIAASNDPATGMQSLNQMMRKRTQLKQYRDILRRMLGAHWQWQSHPLPAQRQRFERLQRLYKIVDGPLSHVPYEQLVTLHEVLQGLCQMMIKESDAVAASHPDIRDLLFMENEKENIPV